MLQVTALGSKDYQLRIPVRLRQVTLLTAAPTLAAQSSGMLTPCTPSWQLIIEMTP